MPRTSRKTSTTGIYHIMIRGINKQQIFHENEDNCKFIKILNDCKQISNFELFGYCLMGNHVHLLIKPGNEALEIIFKRIGTKYVYWYNMKYMRVGHLFQDRYKSEPIESERQLLTVLRYIHQNPIKANLCKNVEDYKWSSYYEYIKERNVVDTAFVLNIITINEFVEFNSSINDDSYLEDSKPRIYLNDENIMKIIKIHFGCETKEAFKQLNYYDRNKCIKHLKSEGGTIRQISRLTGLSKGIVERI